jgi:hypothetical protein
VNQRKRSSGPGFNPGLRREGFVREGNSGK